MATMTIGSPVASFSATRDNGWAKRTTSSLVSQVWAWAADGKATAAASAAMTTGVAAQVAKRWFCKTVLTLTSTAAFGVRRVRFDRLDNKVGQ